MGLEYCNLAMLGPVRMNKKGEAVAEGLAQSVQQ